MTERELPLDLEAANLLNEVRKRVALPPWKLQWGNRFSTTIRLVLEAAKERGTEPEPDFRPPYVNRRPKYLIHLDTQGILEDRTPNEVGSILRSSMREYMRDPTPNGGVTNGRLEEGIELSQQVITHIYRSAFRNRRTSVEEGTILVDEAIQNLIDGNLPTEEDTARMVYLKPEPVGYKTLRVFSLNHEWNLDQMIETEIRRIVSGRKTIG